VSVADAAAVPESFDELVTTIRARHETLTPSQRKLALRVMADPEAVAFMTVSELAAATGVNEATVVRFATVLGLKGFPGLTRLCQERLQEQAQLLRRFDNLQSVDHEGGGLIEQTVALDQANIARTFARIDERTWKSAVDRLAHAPRVHVLGLRKAHAPAYLLGYLLGMMRENVATIVASAGSLTDELRKVRSGDCFVAMSIHRYSVDTVRAAEWARQEGAHVIACTDNPGSPLVGPANDVFYVDASSASVLRSMTAFTSLVQAMSGGVAGELGHDARETLLEEERLLRGFGVYAVNPDVQRS
jgi:DNA-binding MurR/RpiR family transcriptional regulator